jgi:vacuolar-type H+-ATPase subunit F/Vma7
MAGPAPRQVVAIGSEAHVAGFALAGVRTVPAATADETRRAWEELPTGTAVVVLTAEAAAVLGDARFSAGSPLSVVLPTGGPSPAASSTVSEGARG